MKAKGWRDENCGFLIAHCGLKIRKTIFFIANDSQMKARGWRDENCGFLIAYCVLKIRKTIFFSHRLTNEGERLEARELRIFDCGLRIENKENNFFYSQ
jgi:hypothetical protein